MKNRLLRIALFAFAMVVVAPSAMTQCPMCKIGAESNLRNGGTAGKGLNGGILYMLAMPYLLVSTLGFIWYKNRKKESDISDN